MRRFRSAASFAGCCRQRLLNLSGRGKYQQSQPRQQGGAVPEHSGGCRRSHRSALSKPAADKHALGPVRHREGAAIQILCIAHVGVRDERADVGRRGIHEQVEGSIAVQRLPPGQTEARFEGFAACGADLRRPADMDDDADRAEEALAGIIKAERESRRHERCGEQESDGRMRRPGHRGHLIAPGC